MIEYYLHGGVAQLGERLNGIQEVKSSILSVSTKVAPDELNQQFIWLAVFSFWCVLLTGRINEIKTTA